MIRRIHTKLKLLQLYTLAVPNLGWVLAQRWYYHQQLSVADENELRADHIMLLCRVGIPSRCRLARQWRIQDFMKRRGCFAYVLSRAAKLAHAHYITRLLGRGALDPGLFQILREWLVSTYERACLIPRTAYPPTYRDNFPWVFYLFSLFIIHFP